MIYRLVYYKNDEKNTGYIHEVTGSFLIAANNNNRNNFNKTDAQLTAERFLYSYIDFLDFGPVKLLKKDSAIIIKIFLEETTNYKYILLRYEK